ncbi:hypothetical protein COY88_04010, partial [Candidatus Roizmanbacteria bacterium CG_4_10_14_0_8_um_filter_35_28]
MVAVCVRKNSNRFRPKFVGRAEFPPNPPSARLQKRPFRIGRFQVFRSAFGGTPSFARFGGKFFSNLNSHKIFCENCIFENFSYLV